MPAFKNIALAGASGALGTHVLEKLQASGKFNIRVLRRIGSPSTFPSNVNVVDVDFDSVDALTAALKDQDAVVSTVGMAQILPQRTIIDAAIAAGVKRFIPSEFGSDLSNPRNRTSPVYAHKVQIQEYISEKAKTSGITYTYIYNNAFLDWGLEQNFLLRHSEYTPDLVDGGENTFSATSLSSVADAVVGVLSHPEETKNRAVFIEDIKTTQIKLLELAKKAAPGKPWQPRVVKLDDLIADADARLAQGDLGLATFVPYLYRSVMDPRNGGNFVKTDNELLGVKGITEEELFEFVKKYVK
ncbi:Isoflavone reductase-like protein [Hapsidospora chrysogenum ATCC 11550]|uniref:Isoflavone reductase-like protein n=1 Tax=Hapsidospora chrysogenum (strain ATCC 11550 / CBS 779.69 / DSM 880 / IAM 14645 / JCM 23072 / IMI 49137) TaxID=857340 RepID=A0A086T093_HAPC1|nr:Isoflavone reductase-like protein [Hapsidospora chrysogenum ATCC 11550]